MPVRPKSRRGGSRPGAGRAKVPTEQDLDRFFIVIWRVLARLMGYGPRDAGISPRIWLAPSRSFWRMSRALSGGRPTTSNIMLMS